MKKILLTDSNNLLFEADLVRYFSYDDEYFLIYTLNERDQKDYVKLYLIEILEELNELVCYNLKDDYIWDNMQDIIRNVIKEIKSNTKDKLQDLDPLELERIKIKNPRYFKLDEKLVKILSANYLEENYEEIDIEPIDLPDDEIIILDSKEETMDIVAEKEIDNANYKELYYALKSEKEATDEAFEKVLDQLIKYKEKYGELES